MDEFVREVPGRISVVVPSFQQGRYIERTLRSLLDQGDANLEIIVRDGGSTDETVEILRRYSHSVSWESKKDGGQTQAINEGLRAASGEICAYLNSDDILYPGALREIRAAFAAHSEADLVYGQAEHIGETDEIIEPYLVEDWNYQRLKTTCFLCQPATFWRRRIHEEIGYFDESLQFCMDYEFWLRAGQKHQFLYLPKVLAGSRRHSETKTFRLRKVGHREIVRVVARYNQGRVPLKWIKARAKTEAEAGLHLQDPILWSWSKYATAYWWTLIGSLHLLTLGELWQVAGVVSPPYWSSRKITAAA